MSDLLSEVDEALKQERFEKFWAENANLIIGAVLAIIFGTAAVSGWQYWQQSQNEQAATAFIQASNAPDTDAALKEFANQSSAGPAALAYLTAAHGSAASGDIETAIALYENAATNAKSKADLKDFANIMAVRARHAQGYGEDVEQAQADFDLLNAIKNQKDSPWAAQAAYELALLSAGPLDNRAQAIQILSDVDALDIPESLRQRSKALRTILQSKTATQDQNNAQ